METDACLRPAGKMPGDTWALSLRWALHLAVPRRPPVESDVRDVGERTILLSRGDLRGSWGRTYPPREPWRRDGGMLVAGPGAGEGARMGETLQSRSSLGSIQVTRAVDRREAKAGPGTGAGRDEAQSMLTSIASR